MTESTKTISNQQRSVFRRILKWLLAGLLMLLVLLSVILHFAEPIAERLLIRFASTQEIELTAVEIEFIGLNQTHIKNAQIRFNDHRIQLTDLYLDYTLSLAPAIQSVELKLLEWWQPDNRGAAASHTPPSPSLNLSDVMASAFKYSNTALPFARLSVERILLNEAIQVPELGLRVERENNTNLLLLTGPDFTFSSRAGSGTVIANLKQLNEDPATA